MVEYSNPNPSRRRVSPSSFGPTQKTIVQGVESGAPIVPGSEYSTLGMGRPGSINFGPDAPSAFYRPVPKPMEDWLTPMARAVTSFTTGLAKEDETNLAAYQTRVVELEKQELEKEDPDWNAVSAEIDKLNVEYGNTWTTRGRRNFQVASLRSKTQNAARQGQDYQNAWDEKFIELRAAGHSAEDIMTDFDTYIGSIEDSYVREALNSWKQNTAMRLQAAVIGEIDKQYEADLSLAASSIANELIADFTGKFPDGYDSELAGAVFDELLEVWLKESGTILPDGPNGETGIEALHAYRGPREEAYKLKKNEVLQTLEQFSRNETAKIRVRTAEGLVEHMNNANLGLGPSDYGDSFNALLAHSQGLPPSVQSELQENYRTNLFSGWARSEGFSPDAKDLLLTMGGMVKAYETSPAIEMLENMEDMGMIEVDPSHPVFLDWYWDTYLTPVVENIDGEMQTNGGVNPRYLADVSARREEIGTIAYSLFSNGNYQTQRDEYLRNLGDVDEETKNLSWTSSYLLSVNTAIETNARNWVDPQGDTDNPDTAEAQVVMERHNALTLAGGKENSDAKEENKNLPSTNVQWDPSYLAENSPLHLIRYAKFLNGVPSESLTVAQAVQIVNDTYADLGEGEYMKLQTGYIGTQLDGGSDARGVPVDIIDNQIKKPLETFLGMEPDEQNADYLSNARQVMHSFYLFDRLTPEQRTDVKNRLGEENTRKFELIRKAITTAEGDKPITDLEFDGIFADIAEIHKFVNTVTPENMEPARAEVLAIMERVGAYGQGLIIDASVFHVGGGGLSWLGITDLNVGWGLLDWLDPNDIDPNLLQLYPELYTGEDRTDYADRDDLIALQVDLGKRGIVGEGQIGVIHQELTRGLCDRYGLDPEKDVHTVATLTQQLWKAMTTDKKLLQDVAIAMVMTEGGATDLLSGDEAKVGVFVDGLIDSVFDDISVARDDRKSEAAGRTVLQFVTGGNSIRDENGRKKSVKFGARGNEGNWEWNPAFNPGEDFDAYQEDPMGTLVMAEWMSPLSSLTASQISTDEGLFLEGMRESFPNVDPELAIEWVDSQIEYMRNQNFEVLIGDKQWLQFNAFLKLHQARREGTNPSEMLREEIDSGMYVYFDGAMTTTDDDKPIMTYHRLDETFEDASLQGKPRWATGQISKGNYNEFLQDQGRYPLSYTFITDIDTEGIRNAREAIKNIPPGIMTWDVRKYLSDENAYRSSPLGKGALRQRTNTISTDAAVLQRAFQSRNPEVQQELRTLLGTLKTYGREYVSAGRAGGGWGLVSDAQLSQNIDALALRVQDNPSEAIRVVDALKYNRENIVTELNYDPMNMETRINEYQQRWENLARLVEAEEIKTSMHSGSRVRGYLESRQVLPADRMANLGYQVGQWDRNAVIGGLKVNGPLDSQLREVINRPYLDPEADATEDIDIQRYRNFTKWWRSVGAPVRLSSVKNSLGITENELQARHSRFATTYGNLQDWERSLLSEQLGILNENQFVSHMILSDYTMHNTSSDPEILSELMGGRDGQYATATRRERMSSQSKTIKPLRKLPKDVWNILMEPGLSSDNWLVRTRNTHPDEYKRLMEFANKDPKNMEILSQWFMWRTEAGRVGWNMEMSRDKALSRFTSWRTTN